MAGADCLGCARLLLIALTDKAHHIDLFVCFCSLRQREFFSCGRTCLNAQCFLPDPVVHSAQCLQIPPTVNTDTDVHRVWFAQHLSMPTPHTDCTNTTTHNTFSHPTQQRFITYDGFRRCQIYLRCVGKSWLGWVCLQRKGGQEGLRWSGYVRKWDLVSI